MVTAQRVEPLQGVQHVLLGRHALAHHRHGMVGPMASSKTTAKLGSSTWVSVVSASMMSTLPARSAS